MIRFPWRRPRPAGSAAQPQTDEAASSSGRASQLHRERRAVLAVEDDQFARGRADDQRGRRACWLWYYTEALSRPASVNASVRASLCRAPAGEGVTLPTFEAVAFAASAAAAASPQSVPSARTIAAVSPTGWQASRRPVYHSVLGSSLLDRAPEGGGRLRRAIGGSLPVKGRSTGGWPVRCLQAGRWYVVKFRCHGIGEGRPRPFRSAPWRRKRACRQAVRARMRCRHCCDQAC